MRQNLLRLLAALVLIALAAAAFSIPRQAGAESTAPKIVDPPHPLLLKQIRRYQRKTWHLQRLMGVRRSPASASLHKARDREYRLWVRNLWHTRAVRSWKRWQTPPRRSAWMCIHTHERNPRQGWRTNTGNGYYGGLQMDMDFQRDYGLALLMQKGTADRWTALEQIWVADHAFRAGRGFHPWPRTARMCGLL